MTTTNLEHLIERARGEYLEMPGLSLTVPQAGRLWGVDSLSCRRLLDRLVAEKFLTVTHAGTFVRQDDGRPGPKVS
jgi:hypothetical protein